MPYAKDVSFQNLVNCESGASLVEYAVALIVVVTIGGLGLIAVGGDAGGLAEIASDAVSEANTDTMAAIGG